MATSDPTRLRGSAKGQITRVKLALESMQKMLPEDLDVASIDKQMEIANRADTAFRRYNQELIDQHEEDDSEDNPALIQCDAELLAHAKAMQHVINLTKTLRACEQASTQGLNLVLALEDLVATSGLGYTASMATQYSDAEADLKAFRATLTTRGVLANTAIALLRQQTSDLWTKVNHTRAVAEREARERAAAISSGDAATGPEVRLIRSGGNVKVPTPSFSGHPEDFQSFKTFFLTVINQQTHLADQEKNAVLLGSLKLDSDKVKAQTAISSTTTFKDAMEQFSESFENPRDLMSRHLNQVLQIKPIGLNKLDLERLDRVIAETESGLKRINSYKMEQFLPAYLDRRQA